MELGVGSFDVEDHRVILGGLNHQLEGVSTRRPARMPLKPTSIARTGPPTGSEPRF